MKLRLNIFVVIVEHVTYKKTTLLYYTRHVLVRGGGIQQKISNIGLKQEMKSVSHIRPSLSVQSDEVLPLKHLLVT